MTFSKFLAHLRTAGGVGGLSAGTLMPSHPKQVPCWGDACGEAGFRVNESSRSDGNKRVLCEIRNLPHVVG